MVKKGKSQQSTSSVDKEGPVIDTESSTVESAPGEQVEDSSTEPSVDAPVNKKKKVAAEAVKEAVAETNGEVVVNGDKESPSEDAPKVEAKAEEKSEKIKSSSKPIKKVIPSWASLSENAKKSISKSMLPKPKVQDAILAAMAACGDSKGIVSAGAIAKYVLKDNPDLPKMVLKKAVSKAIEKGLIKQVKGKGFSGSFKMESAKKVAKGLEKKSAKKTQKGSLLEDEFPLVFTWACNPKEASVGFIRKYLVKHYPDLNVEENPKAFKKALEQGESKGQLERVTGQGFSGTFALVDGANKTGSKFEDALENAIIAMSEPKQVSVSGLRDYLSVYHKEYNTDGRPTVLKNALARAEAKGWVKQISGKGFTGTYRLNHPYYPSPKELWGPLYEEKNEVSKKRKAPIAKSERIDESDEESDEEDEDEEIIPKPKKRGAPSPRKTAAAPLKTNSKKKVNKKKAPVKKGKKAKK